ncbi:PIG-L deacetylase family protein [Oceanispirochaeta sp.]|jgi:LmbE family N-acetylglucosaminyl deacetylase|uniref:PIG-L deacetylase family protein n=1 Tax=Oceanispirochaeta sp. TaxID=2035350 RepID=UPI00260179E9|nr:PIG-L deacetylase family protein [Oceanispirochaeta sp.]MDA3956622.1 PIG-L family deacetylase [Oceanispirochaeta sp.]
MTDFNKNVLVVQAHPDDAEAWCAGTLALLKNAGFKISIATMTAGGMGGMSGNEDETICVRKKEARKAAALLDADYYCLDQRDGFVFDHEEVRIRMVDIIRKTKAGIVITHLLNDYHADHRATGAICDAAAMISSLPNVPSREEALPVTPLLYHSAPMSLSDPLGFPMASPHFYVDIGSTIDVKLKMLGCHESQIQLMKHMHKIDDFFGEMKKFSHELGIGVGVDYAECFWQHLGGGFQKNPLIQDVLKKHIILKEK